MKEGAADASPSAGQVPGQLGQVSDREVFLDLIDVDGGEQPIGTIEVAVGPPPGRERHRGFYDGPRSRPWAMTASSNPVGSSPLPIGTPPRRCATRRPSGRRPSSRRVGRLTPCRHTVGEPAQAEVHGPGLEGRRGPRPAVTITVDSRTW